MMALKKRYLLLIVALSLSGCGNNDANLPSADPLESSSEMPSRPAVVATPGETQPEGAPIQALPEATQAEVSPEATTPTSSPTPNPEAYETERILPVDETSQNPEYLSFRDELLKKIDERDMNYLKAHVDPDILWSGMERGADLLEMFWHEEEWLELKRVLELGGKFDDPLEPSHFAAPYVTLLFPDTFDAFEYVVALKGDVKVYAERNERSDVLDVLDYEIVKAAYEDGDWTPVTTPRGVKGYVKSKETRSPLNYRASFAVENGVWSLVAFVAGD